ASTSPVRPFAESIGPFHRSISRIPATRGLYDDGLFGDWFATPRSLHLFDTQVTDAGLVHFRELKQLQELNLYGTQVTDEGVAELQKALPDCVIIH
ncbi:MAG: hypothetical protein N2C14_01140, partial [Planctomycetales bacterium]